MPKPVSEVVAALARIGKEVYVPFFLDSATARYRNRQSNWIEALGFFLNGYAFERQGRSPEYAPVACEALTLLSAKAKSGPSRVFANELWIKFCTLGGYGTDADGAKPAPPFKGANKKMNPLNPETNTDTLTICRGLKDHNLFSFAAVALKGNQIGQAHAKLDEIRGVGSKIASFFLRDVALDTGAEVRKLDNRDLLQPIDVWVRRIARILSENRDAAIDDSVAATEMTRLADASGSCALLLNAGSWYFGSQVVASLREMPNALASAETIESALLQHGRNLDEESKRITAACLSELKTRSETP
jgi:hypothetical protein